MSWIKKLFSHSSSRQVSAQNPLIIDSPRIAFLNLIGRQAESQVNEDKQAFGELFGLVETHGTDVPSCDVLMIYCDLTSDGMIPGESHALRDLIDTAAAPVAIVASENGGSSYVAAGKRNGHAPVNLVMTLERKGDAFTNFFGALFRRMFSGQSMLLAWVELAPQGHGVTHDDCPETIFAAEVSHIVFRHP